MAIKSNRLQAEELECNFADIHPPFAFEEVAVIEANRCLNCYDAPCTKLCPTSIDIPQFIRQIASGNLKGSARTIFSSNIMGAGCSKVCPVEKLCEGVCVYNLLKEKPVPIARLQRYSTERALKENWNLFTRRPATGKKVAVVGAGPAGLACAHALAIRGIEVTIYEKEERPGGLMTYGIAAYKVTTESCRREVDFILAVGGISIETGIELGRHVTLAELKEKYDAVFLGIGVGNTRALNIPGEDFEGVVDAVAFINRIRSENLTNVAVGEKVAVVGMGMTAIDAATQAKRLGASEVTLIYRRSAKEKPCTDNELKIARLDGCRVMWLTSPKEVTGKNGKITGIICDIMKLGDPDSSGRRAPVPTGETIFLDVDMVIKATGQIPREELIRNSGLNHVNGLITAGKKGETNIPGIFAGGDAVNGGKEVVNAVQAGKEAAESILEYLGV